MVRRPSKSHHFHKPFSLQPHILKLERSGTPVNASAIKKNRKVIRTLSRKPFLQSTWKLDFPLRRNKKSIKARPRGILLIIGPHRRPSCKWKIHKTLLKNKVRKLNHDGIQANISRLFSRKASDIEVAPNTPRQLPHQEESLANSSQRELLRASMLGL